MSLMPPQNFRKTEGIHRIGLAVDKPLASDVLVGTLYFSTDTFTLERSNGISWDNYSPAGSSPISNSPLFLPSINDFDESPDLSGAGFSNVESKINTLNSQVNTLNSQFNTLGIWQNEPYNAANFFGEGGSWIVTSGNVATNSYTVIGKTMFWSITITASSVPSGISRAVLVIPGGYTLAPGGFDSFSFIPSFVFDSTGPQINYHGGKYGDQHVYVSNPSSSIPAGYFYLYFTIILPLS